MSNIYEKYEQSIKNVRKAKVAVHNKRLIIILSVSAAVGITSAVLLTKGISGEIQGLESEIVYGTEYDPTADGFLSGESRIYYAKEGTEDWTLDKPTLVGQYKVKAVNKNGFNADYSSKEYSFSIVKKDIDATIKESSCVYGDKLTFDFNSLVDGDQVLSYSQTYTYIPSDTTSPVKAVLDIANTKIVNAEGDDVTYCYNINAVEKDVGITRRDLDVVFPNATKEYDGENLTSSEEPVISQGYSLADGDHIEYVSSEITDIGSSENKCDYKIMHGEGDSAVDVTSLYNVTPHYGTLTVTKKQITLHTGDYSKVYDGIKVTEDDLNDEFSMTGSLRAEDEIKITYDRVNEFKATDSEFNSLTYKIVDKNGLDVTDKYYEVTTEFGSFNIGKATLSYTTPEYNYSYGSDLSVIDLTDWQYSNSNTDEQLRNGDTLSFTLDSNAYCKPGDYSFTAHIASTSGVDVSSCYNLNPTNGMVRIETRKIQITLPSYDGEYDGKRHTLYASDITFKTDGGYQELADGDKLTLANPLSLLNAGEYVDNHKISDVTITDKYGRDVTSYYDISFAAMNNSYIRSRELTIENKDFTKEYDGKAIYADAVSSGDFSDFYEIKAGTLAENETLNVSPDSRYYSDPNTVGKDVNTYANILTFDIDHTVTSEEVANNDYTEASGSKIKATSNYAISNLNNTGTSETTITKRNLVITSNNYEKTYDGTTSISSAEYSASGLAEGDFIESGVKLTTSRINADEVTKDTTSSTINVDASDIKIKNESDEDVTQNYNVTTVSQGKVTIKKRNIVVNMKAEASTFIYDGTYHYFDNSGSNYEVTGELASGDTLTIKDSNKNDVGCRDADDEVQNCQAEYEISNSKNEYAEDNYNVTLPITYFKISKRDLDINTGSAERVFTNKPLTCNEWWTSEKGKTDIDGVQGEYIDSSKFSLNSSVTDASDTGVENKITGEIKILRTDGSDSTSNYNIYIHTGSLRVTQRIVSVKITDAEYEYDGEAVDLPTKSNPEKLPITADLKKGVSIYNNDAQGDPDAEAVDGVDYYYYFQDDSQGDVESIYGEINPYVKAIAVDTTKISDGNIAGHQILERNIAFVYVDGSNNKKTYDTTKGVQTKLTMNKRKITISAAAQTFNGNGTKKASERRQITSGSLGNGDVMYIGSELYSTSKIYYSDITDDTYDSISSCTYYNAASGVDIDGYTMLPAITILHNGTEDVTDCYDITFYFGGITIN